MRRFCAGGLASRRSSTFLSKESRNFAEYTKEYDFSVKQPAAYWKAVGERYLTWDKPFSASFAGTMGHDLRYYVGGRLNASYNAVDRHVEKGLGEQRALIWEGDEPGETRDVTYNQLSDGVNRFANLLRSVGVGAGDAVVIYMPPCPEAVFAMLGCARIGAVHAVVFAGFSAEALRARILHVGAKVVVTVDAMTRSGRTVPLKENVDEALLACPDVRRVIVSQRTKDGNMVRGRDIALTDALSRQRPWCPPESFDSEHNLFVLYTSGSTGAPKGLVHTTGGYLAYAALTHQKLFDFRPGDIHACVADIGWITGHTYIVYGPLLNGATSLMFEGVPTHPGPDRYWDMVARHKISTFYTSPTALRAIAKFGDSHVAKHDLSSLRVLGSVGEPLNAEVWRWYYRVVGQERCSIVDTYWQTETGGAIISPLANVTPMKPGSAALPFFGVEAVLMGADGKEVSDFIFKFFCLLSLAGSSWKGDGHSGAQVALAGPEPHGPGRSRQVSADLFHRISRLFFHRRRRD
jgi:acetyl-CoA synthetase